MITYEELEIKLDETKHMDLRNSPVFSVVCLLKNIAMGPGNNRGTLFILEFVTADGQKREVQLTFSASGTSSASSLRRGATQLLCPWQTSG